MRHPWKCVACSYANRNTDPTCMWCGGTERIAINPVETPNAQQNTPSHEELEALLAIDEAARSYANAPSLPEQIAALAEAYADQRAAYRAFCLTFADH